jgi:hypothetical protein
MPKRIERSQNARMRIGNRMIRRLIGLLLCMLLLCSLSVALEFGTYRLLSLSESEKLILVSQQPDKTKYLLDASSAKITIDGKPAEYKALKAYSTIQLKMKLGKINKLGIELDGEAVEIRIDSGQKTD